MTPLAYFYLRRHLERMSQLYVSERASKNSPYCDASSCMHPCLCLWCFWKNSSTYFIGLNFLLLVFFFKFLFIIFLVAFRWLPKRERGKWWIYTPVFKPEISLLSFWWHFPIYTGSHERAIHFLPLLLYNPPASGKSKDILYYHTPMKQK